MVHLHLGASHSVGRVSEVPWPQRSERACDWAVPAWGAGVVHHEAWALQFRRGRSEAPLGLDLPTIWTESGKAGNWADWGLANDVQSAEPRDL